MADSIKKIDIKDIADKVKQKVVESKFKKAETIDIYQCDLNEMQYKNSDNYQFENAIDSSNITSADVESLIETLSQDEYDDFVKGVEGYYQKQLDSMEKTSKELGNLYNNVHTALDSINNNYNPNAPQINIYDILNNLSQVTGIDISSYEQLKDLDKELEGRKTQIDEYIKQAENNKKSAKYDYLVFLKDYGDYNYTELTQEHYDSIKTDSNIQKGNQESYVSSQTTDNNIYYSFSEYHKKHPEISPIEYIMMLEKQNPNGGYIVYDLGGVENFYEIQAMVQASDTLPDFAKTYSYLYEIDPEKANEFVKDCHYEINSLRGQLQAKEFLDTLDPNNPDFLNIVANELGITGQGLEDGLSSFVEGNYYALEAIFTGAGFSEENRETSVSEYRKMYILQALLSDEEKEKAGLISKGDNGEYVNTAPSLIDFTESYGSSISKRNYEVSQGIGNMLPSIGLGLVAPPLGSISLGISAGGNAYHGAMVEGHDYLQSLLYGIASGTTEAITEKYLGGLPGLSDVEVKSVSTWLKSLAKEGNEEVYQNFIDAFYRTLILNEEVKIPTTEEEFLAFLDEQKETWLNGAITSGVLNIPNLTGSLHAHGSNMQQTSSTNVNISGSENGGADVSNLSSNNGNSAFVSQQSTARPSSVSTNLSLEQVRNIIQADPLVRVEGTGEIQIIDGIEYYPESSVPDGVYRLSEIPNGVLDDVEISWVDNSITSSVNDVISSRNMVNINDSVRFLVQTQGEQETIKSLASYVLGQTTSTNGAMAIISQYSPYELIENLNKIGMTNISTTVSDAMKVKNTIETMINTIGKIKTDEQLKLFLDSGDLSSIDSFYLGMLSRELGSSRFTNALELVMETRDDLNPNVTIGNVSNASGQNTVRHIDSSIDSSQTMDSILQRAYDSLNDYDSFKAILDNIKSYKDDTLPDGFKSAEDYKRTFIRSLIDSGRISELKNGGCFYELTTDPIFLSELVGNEKLTKFVVGNLSRMSTVQGVTSSLNKLSYENFNRLFSENDIKSLIDSMEIDDLKLVLNSFSNTGLAFLQNETIINKLLSLNDDELLSILINLKNNYGSDFKGFYSLLDDSSCYFELLDEIEKRFFKAEMFYENFSDIKVFLGRLYYKAYGNERVTQFANKISEMKDKLNDRVVNISNGLINSSSTGSLYFNEESFVPNVQYYIFSYMIDGKKYTEKLTKYGNSLSLNLSDNMITALYRGNITDLKLEPDVLKNNAEIDSSMGYKPGLNEVKIMVDGVEKTIVINNISDSYNVSYHFPDAQSLEVKSVKSMDSFNIDGLTNGRIVKIVFETYDGIVTSYGKVDEDGKLNIDDIISSRDIVGVRSVQNVTELDLSDVISSISDISIYNASSQVFSDESYGGNQSDVPNFLLQYLDNSGDAIVIKKGEILSNLLNRYFENISDVDKVKLAKHYEEGGCVYMALANAFATYMGSVENGAQIFRDRFGYDLYVVDGNKISYNVEAIAFEMYLNLYSGNSVSNIISSGSAGLNEAKLEECLELFKKYDIKVDYESYIYDSMLKNVMSDVENARMTLLLRVLQDNSMFHMLIANDFSMEFIGDSINLTESSDGALADANINGNLREHVGAHGMTITGVDSDGNFIVSSWSGKYKVPISEVVSNYINGDNKARIYIRNFDFSILNDVV